MWLAIFADVGVMVIAVLNAIRALNVKRILRGDVKKLFYSTRIICGFLIIFDFSMKTEACFDMIILKIKNTVHTIFI